MKTNLTQRNNRVKPVSMKKTDKLMKFVLALALFALVLPIVAFSQPIPPPKPNVKAVIGDGMVTLYWDDVAESHFDPFFEDYVIFRERVSSVPLLFNEVKANPRNFQGYRIYRSTDPQFLDALRITDNQGNPSRLRPEITFDLPNNIRGFHPAAIGGQRIDLGNDTGIRRFWVDSDGLVNGRTYYYAVVSYTFGDATPDFVLPIIDESGNIIEPDPLPNAFYLHPPLESGIDIEIRNDGTIITGVNVVKVVPQAGAAGYVPPADPTVERVTGSGRGNIEVSIVDPLRLRGGNSYSIVFQDTLVDGTIPGSKDLVTKNFSLINNTTGQVLFNEVEDFTSIPLPIVDGLQLSIESLSDRVEPDLVGSEWVTSQSSNIHNFVFGISTSNPAPNDYRIEFSDDNVRQSLPFTIVSGNTSLNLPIENVNFRIFNTITGNEVDFAYFTNPNLPRDLRAAVMLSATDAVISGAAGLVQRTTDGGETWDVAETGVTVRLNGLSFIDNQRGWAAGRQGTVIRTTDAGATWSAPQNTGVDVILRGIYFVNENIGYAVGDGGVIIKTTNGGQSWTQQNSGGNRRLNDVFFTDQNNGWAVGLLTVLRTTDGGATWTTVPPGVSAEFFGLYFTSASTGWIVGTNGRILKTTDAGATWVNQGDASFQTLNEIKFVNDQIGWAVGNNGSIIRTTNGGDTWTSQTSGTQGILYGLGVFDANTAIVVGTNSIRIRTSNAGSTWTLTENFRRFRAAFDDNGTPRSDAIYILEDLPFDNSGDLRDTWRVSMLPRTATSEFGLTVDPVGGDQLVLFTIKPFTSADRFDFVIDDANLPSVDLELAKDQMADIKVVPNPYLVTHIAEPVGERQLHFINLPQQCTIRIFSVSGRLIQTLEVNNPANNNRFIWDMMTNTNDDLPYGVYIYHVSAPGVGEKVGKFAVIK